MIPEQGPCRNFSLTLFVSIESSAVARTFYLTFSRRRAAPLRPSWRQFFRPLRNIASPTMPTSLADLPLELLPEILAPLVSRRDLYNVCLVSRDWREVGQARLLRHVRLFGRDLVRKLTHELCRQTRTDLLRYLGNRSQSFRDVGILTSPRCSRPQTGDPRLPNLAQGPRTGRDREGRDRNARKLRQLRRACLDSQRRFDGPVRPSSDPLHCPRFRSCRSLPCLAESGLPYTA